MVTVTKVKKSGAKKAKHGELLHNDQDTMEYLDEEQNDTDPLHWLPLVNNSQS